jgi:UDP-2,4-diacetamido-2,4,6-trideoxy-beta-L-altropyranose hydrolase
MDIKIVTEAGPDFGIGHQRRCQALATGFEQTGHTVSLEINTYKPLESAVDVLVIDSYHLTLAQYQAYKLQTNTLLVIDDNNRLTYPADILINPSLGAEQIPYTTTAQLLVGADYALLNSLYWQSPRVTIEKDIKTVLITLGGSRFAGLTNQLAVQLATLEPTVQILTTSGLLSPQQMYDLYRQSDVVISGAGQTLHELACLGLPTIAVQLADNQKWNIEQWQKVGFIDKVTTIDSPQLLSLLSMNLSSLTYQKRLARSQIGRKYVDGRGVQRVIQFVTNYVRY